MSPRRWLLLIVGVGALLRLYAIWFGFPYPIARPDEEVAVGFARKILNTGDPNPGFFHWPSLTFYVFAGLDRLTTLAARITGLGRQLTFQQHIVICRIFVACMGTLTIVVLYRIGRRVAGEWTGLAAAALLAVAILHVRDSHFAMTDVLMTLFVTLALALLLRAMDESDVKRALRWYAASGFAGGLAASTKYNAAALVAAMLAAQALLFWRAPRLMGVARGWLPSVLFGAFFFAAFLAGTPYSVVDYSTFSAHLAFDFNHLSEGHYIDLGRGWTYHLTRSIPYGVGFGATALALLGAGPFARHYGRYALVLGGFCLALYLSVGSGYTVFFRYVLAVVPIVCLSAAIAVGHIASWIAARWTISERKAYGWLLAAAILPGLANCVWFDVLLARTDSRVIAAAWLTERLEPEDTLYDSGGLYASLDLRVAYRTSVFDKDSRAFVQLEGTTPAWIVLHDSPVSTYTRVPPEVLDLVRRDYALVKTVPATRSVTSSAVYDLQDAFFLPVWGFWTVERPGPNVNIYKRRDLISRVTGGCQNHIPV